MSAIGDPTRDERILAAVRLGTRLEEISSAFGVSMAGIARALKRAETRERHAREREAWLRKGGGRWPDEMPVGLLDAPNRLLTGLCHIGVRDVGQAARIELKRLLLTPNLGKGSARDLETALAVGRRQPSWGAIGARAPAEPHPLPWRAISSAPRHGEEVLVWTAAGPRLATWRPIDGNGGRKAWHGQDGRILDPQPTRWMRVTPPRDEKGADEAVLPPSGARVARRSSDPSPRAP